MLFKEIDAHRLAIFQHLEVAFVEGLDRLAVFSGARTSIHLDGMRVGSEDGNGFLRGGAGGSCPGFAEGVCAGGCAGVPVCANADAQSKMKRADGRTRERWKLNDSSGD